MTVNPQRVYLYPLANQKFGLWLIRPYVKRHLHLRDQAAAAVTQAHMGTNNISNPNLQYNPLHHPTHSLPICTGLVPQPGARPISANSWIRP